MSTLKNDVNVFPESKILYFIPTVIWHTAKVVTKPDDIVFDIIS